MRGWPKLLASVEVAPTATVTVVAGSQPPTGQRPRSYRRSDNTASTGNAWEESGTGRAVRKADHLDRTAVRPRKLREVGLSAGPYTLPFTGCALAQAGQTNKGRIAEV